MPKPLPSTVVPALDRRALIGAARELAEVLAVEVRQLERDAQAVDQRGLPDFAAQLRALRRRLGGVLALAKAVAAAGGAL